MARPAGSQTGNNGTALSQCLSSGWRTACSSSPGPSSEVSVGWSPSGSRLQRSPRPAPPAPPCSSPPPPPSLQSRWGRGRSGRSLPAEGRRCPGGWHFLCWRYQLPPLHHWTERLWGKQKEPGQTAPSVGGEANYSWSGWTHWGR